ncbi:MAG TPA: sigma factor-like helix-turn-helix DNA-binding protein, partial [Bryobacteraceae bacterium]|nr:sigma factor-like helix-turn-helix DNA-binding protein [Bryobacteraceae bacterium]
LAVEVFLKWWKSPQAHGDHAEGWLYRSAVRKALDEWRGQSRRTRFEQLFRLQHHSPPSPEHLYAAGAGQQRVRAVLGALKPRDSELLLLRAEELSYQEIAAALQLNPHSVGSLISRAQTAFRKEYLKRYGNE